MKNFTFSTEAIVLIVLLLIGLFGAKSMLEDEDAVSPGLALPRQESPAMVMTPTTDNIDAQTWTNN